MEQCFDDNILRSRPEKPSLAISRRTVLAGLSAVAICLVLAIQLGRRGHERKPLEDQGLAASPAAAVALLPSSYAELPPVTPLPTPASHMERDTNLTRALLAAEAERQKRITEGRRSSLSFQGVSLPQLAGSTTGVPDESSDSAYPASARDDVNRQDDKGSFLSKKRRAATRLHERLTDRATSSDLLAGSLIPGLLLSGINSDLPGQILGQVSQNVFDTVSGTKLLVPQGTKIIGQYDSRVVDGQERVLIVWTRLMLPNGKSIFLEGMPGVDLSGYAGLEDKVNNHYLRLLTGVVFSSLLSAGAQVAQGRDYSALDATYQELALQGVARNINDVGQQITRKNLNVQPTLEIRPGFRFNVFVHKDITLEPYEE